MSSILGVHLKHYWAEISNNSNLNACFIQKTFRYLFDNLHTRIYIMKEKLQITQIGCHSVTCKFKKSKKPFILQSLKFILVTLKTQNSLKVLTLYQGTLMIMIFLFFVPKSGK